MTSNSDKLALQPTPRAATKARRWVADACRQLGREDLIESAELGVTELVSNAVLHAKPPIVVQVRGDASRPRIDVVDGSTELPHNPEPTSGQLPTYSRGLAMVAMSSLAWGASVRQDGGKVVWFEPSPTLGTDVPEGTFDPGHQADADPAS